MIINPLQNTANRTASGDWEQVRPYITQHFGERPGVYKQFGMDGHNGTDFRARTPIPVFAPISGKVECKKSDKGYGWHIIISGEEKQVILAHLSEFKIKDGSVVHMGDKVGLTGNTGFSSAPHLHMSFKKLDQQGNVLNHNNGYKGSIDVEKYIICWKGTLLSNTHE